MKKQILKWRISKLLLEVVCLLAILGNIAMFFYTWLHGNLVIAVLCFLAAFVFVYAFVTVLYMYRFNKRTR